ncbi:MAG: glycoside hydrolase family 38 N-terminal domain-containing protein, partial [Anaerolineae bacterium]
MPRLQLTQIHLIPNFHYDVTWHKDMATFMRLSADILLEALDLLDREPSFRYVLDHVTFVEGFLKLHPEQHERLRRHVDSGRIELVGGMYSMMDCDMPDGEAFARQLLYGQRWLERCLGRRARVGWFLDNYGFTPQLPQLLHQAGMDQVEICLWWAPAYMAQHI